MFASFPKESKIFVACRGNELWKAREKTRERFICHPAFYKPGAKIPKNPELTETPLFEVKLKPGFYENSHGGIKNIDTDCQVDTLAILINLDAILAIEKIHLIKNNYAPLIVPTNLEQVLKTPNFEDALLHRQ